VEEVCEAQGLTSSGRCFVEVDMCVGEVDMYVGEPAHAIVGESEAGCKFGRDGRRNMALAVDNRVVEGCMECVDSLGNGVLVGSEGKVLLIWTKYLLRLLRPPLSSFSRAHLPCHFG